MGKTIYITQEIEVELDEIDTDDLRKEIEDRGYYVIDNSPDAETEKEKLNAIKEILGLKEWHTKIEIVRELNNL